MITGPILMYCQLFSTLTSIVWDATCVCFIENVVGMLVSSSIYYSSQGPVIWWFKKHSYNIITVFSVVIVNHPRKHRLKYGFVYSKNTLPGAILEATKSKCGSPKVWCSNHITIYARKCGEGHSFLDHLGKGGNTKDGNEIGSCTKGGNESSIYFSFSGWPAAGWKFGVFWAILLHSLLIFSFQMQLFRKISPIFLR